jgi:cytochrome c553
MHRQLNRTVDIQTGVVLGDLERAQRAASWIATREEQEPLPPQGDPYLEEIRNLASSIVGTDDLPTVAASVGQIAGACGSCHQATGGGPYFVVRSAQPEGESQAERMIRHLWAADRMWEGIVGPSDEAWRAGARALAESEPVFSQVIQAANSPPEAERSLSSVTTLARQALTVTDQGDRAEVYGQILNTCNACHSAMKRMVKKTEAG